MENGSAAISHKPPQACSSAPENTNLSAWSTVPLQPRRQSSLSTPFFHPEILPQRNVSHCLQFPRSWWESCWLEAQQWSIPTLGTCPGFSVHGDPRDLDPTGGAATLSSHPKTIREQSQGAAAHGWAVSVLPLDEQSWEEPFQGQTRRRQRG